MSTMSTDNAKRNVNDGGFASEDLLGGSGSPAAKRLKTDAMATDPTSEVVLNPDTLSKALLYIDMSEVPSVAQTCKVWKHTLDSVEQVLWKGVVEKHCPSLTRVTDMLPDSVGVEEPRDSADGIPAPSKNWKYQFKRRMLIRRSKAKYTKTKPLESYLFEIRCRSALAPERQETIAFIESADCTHQNTNDDWSLVFHEFPLPDNVPKNEAVASVCVHDKSTGREAVLYEGPTDGHIHRLNELVEVYGFTEYYTEPEQEEGHWLLKIVFFLVDSNVECSPEQCLAILDRWLDWK